MDDVEIDNYAKITHASLKLPPEHLINVINEMKVYRMFHNRCKNNTLEINRVRDEYQFESNPYDYLVKCVLRSVKTGLEIGPNTDMDSLLSSWGF